MELIQTVKAMTAAAAASERAGRPLALVFLAVLTVVGMLVSDILLAVLDPRIRLSGGSAR